MLMSNLSQTDVRRHESENYSICGEPGTNKTGRRAESRGLARSLGAHAAEVVVGGGVGGWGGVMVVPRGIMREWTQ